MLHVVSETSSLIVSWGLKAQSSLEFLPIMFRELRHSYDSSHSIEFLKLGSCNSLTHSPGCVCLFW